MGSAIDSPGTDSSTLRLPNLLVQTGDQRGVAPDLLVLTIAENARSGWCLAASWATVSWPFTASMATLALKSGLCLLRSWGLADSFLAATTALNLGAGLSLICLSSFLGPSHYAWTLTMNCPSRLFKVGRFTTGGQSRVPAAPFQEPECTNSRLRVCGRTPFCW